MNILRQPAVTAKTGKSRTRIYEDVAAGTFPAPIKLGPGARAVGWLESEIDAWIAARIAEREASPEREVHAA